MAKIQPGDIAYEWLAAMPGSWRIVTTRKTYKYRLRLGLDHWYDVMLLRGDWRVRERWLAERPHGWKNDDNVFAHGFADPVAAAVAATLRGNTRGTT